MFLCWKRETGRWGSYKRPPVRVKRLAGNGKVLNVAGGVPRRKAGAALGGGAGQVAAGPGSFSFNWRGLVVPISLISTRRGAVRNAESWITHRQVHSAVIDDCIQAKKCQPPRSIPTPKPAIIPKTHTAHLILARILAPPGATANTECRRRRP